MQKMHDDSGIAVWAGFAARLSGFAEKSTAV
jgi:hypothetical protein